MEEYTDIEEFAEEYLKKHEPCENTQCPVCSVIWDVPPGLEPEQCPECHTVFT
jgi:hypothetical protein